MIRSSILCLLAGLLVLSGCGKSAPDANPGGNSAADAKVAVAVKDGKAVAVAESRAPLEFVRAMSEGKAAASALSAGFKTSLTQPGFSAEDSAQTWLDNVTRSRKFTTSDEKTSAGGTIVRGTVSGGDKPEFFTLLIRNGAVEWLHRGPVTATALPADADWGALVTAVGFWDSLAAERPSQAALLLSSALKANLGPPFSTDKDGFNRGAMEARLRGYRDSLEGYTIDAPKVAGETATVGGVLTKVGGTQTFAMKLVREAATGAWKIDELEIK